MTEMNSVRTSLALLNEFIRIKADDAIKKATKKAYDRRRRQDGFYTRDEQKNSYLGFISRCWDTDAESYVQEEQFWIDERNRRLAREDRQALKVAISKDEAKDNRNG